MASSARAQAQLRAYESNRIAAGVAITYHRAAASVPLIAIPGTTTMDVVDADGTTVKVKVRDFLIKASELILDSIVINPARSDQIKEVIGDDEHTMEVIGPAKADCFAWHATDGSVLRVHTKEFDVQLAPSTTSTTTTAPP